MTAAESRVAVLLTLMRQLQEVMRAESALLRELGCPAARAAGGEGGPGRSYEVELRRLRQSPEAIGASARRLGACSRQHARVPGRRRQRRPAAAGALGRGGHRPGDRPEPRAAGGQGLATGGPAAGRRPGRVIPSPSTAAARRGPMSLNAVLSNAMSGLPWPSRR